MTRSHSSTEKSSDMQSGLYIDSEILALARESIDRWKAAGFPAGEPDELALEGEDLEQFLQMFVDLDERQSGSAEQQESITAFGRFEIIEEIGRGGFGIVFRAFDSLLERTVALKLPRPERLVGGDSAHSLIQEAKLSARLQHPGIVSVYDARQLGPIWYIASAYCEGRTLAEWIEDNSASVRCQVAPQLLAQVADAVHYAHAHAVLHLDLKPDNILLESDAAAGASFPRPVVTDFGLGRRSDGPLGPSERIAGTLAYMAPEQRATDVGRIGVATDVYALGAILHELLFGKPPQFKQSSSNGKSDDALLDASATAKVHPDLLAICRKCLAEDPSHRYDSARELAEDLRRFDERKCVQARPAKWPRRMALWYRRRPALATVATLLAIVSMASLATIGTFWSQAETHLAQLQTEIELRNQASARMETSLLSMASMAQEGRLRNLLNRSNDATSIKFLRELLDHMQSWSGSPSDRQTKNDALSAAAHSLSMVDGVDSTNPDELEQHFRQGLEAWRRLVQGAPDSSPWKRALSLHLLTYASRFRDDNWLWWREEAGALDPDLLALVDESYAQLLIELSDSYLHIRAFERTHDMLTAAIAILESHADRPDHDWSRRHWLLLAHARLNRTANFMSAAEEASAAQRNAARLALDAPAAADCEPRLASAVGHALLTHGKLLRKQQEPLDALPILQRAADYLQVALAATPRDTRLRRDLASVHRCMANIHREQPTYALANESFVKAIGVLDGGLAITSTDRELLASRASAHAEMARCCLEGSDQSQALVALEQAVSDYAAIELRRQDTRSTWLSSIRCLQSLGAIYAERGQLNEARSAYEQSMSQLAALRPRMAHHPQHQAYVRTSEEALAELPPHR